MARARNRARKPSHTTSLGRGRPCWRGLDWCSVLSAPVAHDRRRVTKGGQQRRAVAMKSPTRSLDLRLGWAATLLCGVMSVTACTPNSARRELAAGFRVTGWRLPISESVARNGTSVVRPLGSAGSTLSSGVRQRLVLLA